MLDNKKQTIITAVFKDVPVNSSVTFDFVLPYKMMVTENPGIHNWGQNYFKTYLLLNKGTDIKGFDNMISTLIQKKTGSQSSLFLRPYSDRYLYNKYVNGIQTGGRITYVRLFSIIAILILSIACINFINLSTARVSKRIKEVGLKKVLGAPKRNLIFGFIAEAVFITLLALLVSVFIVKVSLPYFNDFAGKHIVLNFQSDMLCFLIIALLVTSLISGIFNIRHLSCTVLFRIRSRKSVSVK